MAVRRNVFGSIDDYRQLINPLDYDNDYVVSDFLTTEGVAEAAFGRRLQGVATKPHDLLHTYAGGDNLFKSYEKYDKYAIDQWADLVAGRALRKTLEQLAADDRKEEILWGNNA